MGRSSALAALAVGLLVACDDEAADSVPVIWSDLHMSPDRRTISVVTSYPLEGVGCAKGPGGVTVSIDESNGVAYIDARMRRTVAAEDVCTLECGSVQQTATLTQPLPAGISRLEPVRGAVPGCMGVLPPDRRPRRPLPAGPQGG